VTDLYDLCRSLNRVLASVVFLWLVWRTVRAWPADWAKPDHVGHYRSLLLTGSGFLLIVSYGAYLHAGSNSTADEIDLASTLACLFVAGICARWPKPRSMRKDTP
jgi:hypothetical protein